MMEYYDVPTQQGTPMEDGVMFIPPCRTTLVGTVGTTQYVYQWDEKRNEYDLKEIPDEKNHKKTGNIVWYSDITQKKKLSQRHISFVGPQNRHCFFTAESILQKKVFSCGKEIEPAPPQVVIGACKRKSEELKIPYSPYIATRESDHSIAFWWLLANPDSKQKTWVKKGSVVFPEKHYVGYTVFFSQDGQRAVTYALEEKEYHTNVAWSIMSVIPYLPQRVEIQISNDGNVSHTLTATTTFTCEDLPPSGYWNIQVSLEGDVASEYVENELRHLHVSQKNVMAVYSSPVGGGDDYISFSLPSLPVTCTVVSDVFGSDGCHKLAGYDCYHWDTYYHFEVRPAASYWDQYISAARTMYIGGRVSICNQKISDFPEERTFFTLGISGRGVIEADAPENLRAFWDFCTAYWAPVIDAGVFEEYHPLKNLTGLYTRRDISASFAGGMLVVVNFVFGTPSEWQPSDGEFSRCTYSLSTGKYDHIQGRVISEFQSGSYTVTDESNGFQEIEMTAKGTSGSIADHGTIRKNPTRQNSRMTIAVCDLNSDIIVLTGNHLLKIMQISTQATLFQGEISHLAYADIGLQPGFAVIDGSYSKYYHIPFDMSEGGPRYVSMRKDGIWSSLNVQYASDKFGNFILNYNNQCKKLLMSNEQRNWTKIGVI